MYDPSTVIAGLDTILFMRSFFSVDARIISAFTRVFRRAMPGHDKSEPIRK